MHFLPNYSIFNTSVIHIEPAAPFQAKPSRDRAIHHSPIHPFTHSPFTLHLLPPEGDVKVQNTHYRRARAA